MSLPLLAASERLQSLHLHQRRNQNIAELHRAVVPLQNEGTGLAFVRIAGNPVKTIYLRLIDHRFTVEHYGHLTPDQADVVDLPLPGRFARVLARRNAAVEGAITVRIRRLAVVFLDLDLVSRPQTNPAIAARRKPAFHVQLEVPELFFREDVASSAGTGQNAVLHGPSPFPFGYQCAPAGEVPVVEEGDGWALAPGTVILVPNDRRAHAGPLHRRVVLALRLERALQPVIDEAGPIDEMTRPPFAALRAILGMEAEHELIAADRDLFDGVEVSVERADELALRGGRARTLDIQPPGMGVIVYLNIPVPVKLGARAESRGTNPSEKAKTP